MLYLEGRHSSSEEMGGQERSRFRAIGTLQKALNVSHMAGISQGKQGSPVVGRRTPCSFPMSEQENKCLYHPTMLDLDEGREGHSALDSCPLGSFYFRLPKAQVGLLFLCGTQQVSGSFSEASLVARAISKSPGAMQEKLEAG